MPATPFIGEIMLFGGNFPPLGWAFCDGQLLSIAQYDALFALIGTTYGGDGQQTFALPDLRGRAPMHVGQGPGLSNRVLGQRVGTESHTLIATEMPQHTHNVRARDAAGTSPSPAGNTWAQTPATHPGYGPATGGADDTMSPSAVLATGGGQSHENRQPSLALNYCIALEGIFPAGNLDIQQFIAEIVMFAGNATPGGWADCNGQILPIAQNQALFSLLGTTYGGNGVSTFALPDLRGRVPLHVGSSPGPGLTPHALGEVSGTESVTLLSTQLPLHNHTAACRPTEGSNAGPVGGVWSKTGNGAPAYGAATAPLAIMSPAALRPAGGSQPHNNMAPTLGIRCMIALTGIFPSRN